MGSVAPICRDSEEDGFPQPRETVETALISSDRLHAFPGLRSLRSQQPKPFQWVFPSLLSPYHDGLFFFLLF